MVNKERNYGIDALRMLSMFMVIVLHILGRGGVLQATRGRLPNYIVGLFLEIAAYCAVNCYAIISGYVGYGRKIRYSNLIYLVFCTIYYIIGLTIIGYFLVPNANLKDVMNSLLHIRNGGYWYVKSYFCAFFFFPHINLIVEKYDQKRLYILAGGIFILFSVIPTLVKSDVFFTNYGYSPLWLMLMYFFGAVIKKHDTVSSDTKKHKYLILYMTMVVVTLLSKLCIAFITQKLFGRAILSNLLISYISPTIVLSGVFMVKFFTKVMLNKLTTKVVSIMSPLAFGVYLIHTQYFIWNYWENRFKDFAYMNPLLLFISVILMAFAIYLICSFIDYIRHSVFKMLKIKELSEQVEKKLFTAIDNIITKK